MKKLLSLFIAVLISASGLICAQDTFTKGVNLTGWFQAANPKQIQFARFTKKDFENIKSLGCDVIRLPINLHAMTSGPPAYTPDPLFLSFLDQAIDWAEELQLHLILDNHTFDPAINTTADVEQVLIKVWTQMAARYKDRSNLIYYEILNEPHGIADQTWSQIQQKVITAIRQEDQRHTIIVGAANWNSYHNLANLPTYSDDNLIYTFHFYDPFVFTHQGASWTDPSMEPLAGVPFPYNAAEMPSFPSSLRGSWIESAFNNYSVEGTAAKMKALIDIAVAFKTSRNVRVFCGEFGVLMNNSNDADRADWYEVSRKYLEEKGIPWTIWDYTGGFGIFEKGGSDLFEYDLNVPLLEALGFTVPVQKEYTLEPDTTGFMIYSDFTGGKIVQSSYGGSVDYYSSLQPNNGSYCLEWSGAPQYGTVAFDLKPDKDLSMLREKDYAIDFLLRGDSPGTRFDIRFLDTKTGADDHPWRMRFTVMEKPGLEWDEKWHHVRVPLKNFSEQGSWDNGAWFNPEGKFDWQAVDRIEIVAEHQSLEGIRFWFDNIYITNMDTAAVHNHKPLVLDVEQAAPEPLFPLSFFPNPVQNRGVLVFELGKPQRIIIELIDGRGRKIGTLADQVKESGSHKLYFENKDENGRPYKHGLYFFRMNLNGATRTVKVVL